MPTIDDTCIEPVLPSGIEPIILFPSIIKSRIQRASENIDLTRQKMKDLNPTTYDTIQDYHTEAAGLITDLDEFKAQRRFLEGLLRTNGHYEE